MFPLTVTQSPCEHKGRVLRTLCFHNDDDDDDETTGKSCSWVRLHHCPTRTFPSHLPCPTPFSLVVLSLAVVAA
jgi:hypothetical protein